MMMNLPDVQGRLLSVVQEEVPLVERPFEEIGRRLGITEEETLSHLRALHLGEPRVIRQLSAIFDTKALGYSSTLVAARVPAERLEAAAKVINRHPGVSHNYERNHRYNLWYTVAVPPDSQLGLDKTVQALHELSGAEQTRLMPTLKLFKIGVKLNLTGESEIAARSAGPRFTQADREAAMAHRITDEDKPVIRVLQQDLPLVPRPFDAWAQKVGVSVDSLLAAARRFVHRKQMRRFSAVLHHREAGFSANGMGVWIVPPAQQQHFGETAATFDAVSHCYLRPTYEDWPYTMFTMVHAPTPAECDNVLATISAATGITDYAALYSTREFKKTRVQYFTPETQTWEAAYLKQQA
jgi:DNA-binding Lrp family transcriptional regulator